MNRILVADELVRIAELLVAISVPDSYLDSSYPKLGYTIYIRGRREETWQKYQRALREARRWGIEWEKVDEDRFVPLG